MCISSKLRYFVTTTSKHCSTNQDNDILYVHDPKMYIRCVWTYTGFKDCLDVSLEAVIDILFIQLWQ